MANIEDFVTAFEALLIDDSHGYSQVDRWGEYGDYDCSSAVIYALRSGGFDVAGATYTGNMREALCARGFIWLAPDVAKERGDILLNEACHVAVYLGDDTLGEFSSDENGGIDGVPGDQNGREGIAHGYYNYPWDGVLRYQGESSESTLVEGTCQEAMVYQVCTGEDGWLEAVTDLNDYAGLPGHAAIFLAIDLGGHGWYRVYSQAGGWLPPVQGYDCNDLQNGVAGDGSPILGIQVYYETPNPEATGYYRACYRAAVIGSEYYPCQYDTETGESQDGYAGDLANPIDRFQLTLTR